MTRSAGKGRGLRLALAVTLGIAGLAAARPAAAQDCTGVAPYVFILLDTSGSMNWAPPCSSAELAAGLCTARCDSYNCWVTLQADDPGSKFFQIKQALHEALSSATGVQLGFATFNQDDLFVSSKHWIYEAAGAGITLPGWGAFPAVGAREVFGRQWICDTGSGDNEIGCYAASPADLSDGWELARVQQLAKAGQAVNQMQTFYVRHAGVTYKVIYTPILGFLGNPVTMNVNVLKCMNSACSSTSSMGQKNLSFVPVAEKIGWDLGVSRTNPGLGYFSSSSSNDSSGINICNGWEPNADTAADAHSGYNLHWPTVSDPRGTAFDLGDMVPLDWTTPHLTEILARLAPNLTTDPMGAPDFRTSPYLQNLPISGQSYLRLKNQNVRPLIAVGSTPLGTSLYAFKQWLPTWRSVAAAQDPDWACRRTSLIVLTDGDESCAANPCTQVQNLRDYYGISTYVVGFGMADGVSALGNTLACMAAYGNTSAPYTPHLRQELVDTLTGILDDIKAGN